MATTTCQTKTLIKLTKPFFVEKLNQKNSSCLENKATEHLKYPISRLTFKLTRVIKHHTEKINCLAWYLVHGLYIGLNLAWCSGGDTKNS
jgi:hypothetical protein